MQKEVLIAIIFGSLLGVVVAFGIWKTNNALKTKENEKVTQELNPGAEDSSAKKEGVAGLSIIKPEEKSVFNTNPVVFSGITGPNQYIIISGEDRDLALISDNSGGFSADLNLISGLNEVGVYSYDKGGNAQKKSLLLIYTTQLGNDNPSEASGEGTVEERVEKKLEEASNKIVANLGTITDIAESSVQFRSMDGDIKQLSITNDTTFANIIKTPKEIKFSDMAIGDFIVAMGQLKEANGLMNSKRVLITSPFKSTTRKVVMGTVNEVGKKELKVKELVTNEILSVDISVKYNVYSIGEKGVVKAKATDVTKDKAVIISGDLKDSSFQPRTIYLTTSGE